MKKAHGPPSGPPPSFDLDSLCAIALGRVRVSIMESYLHHLRAIAIRAKQARLITGCTRRIG